MSKKYKDIPGYEGIYKINRKGVVKNIKRDKELKAFNNYRGYMQVILSKNKVRKNAYIHRLVMLTFVGPSCLEVNHKDGNSFNNDISNLEYVTHIENIRHGYKNNLMNNQKGELHGRSKLTENEVLEIIRHIENKIVGTKIAKKYKVTTSTVSLIKNNKIWKHLERRN